MKQRRNGLKSSWKDAIKDLYVFLRTKISRYITAIKYTHSLFLTRLGSTFFMSSCDSWKRLDTLSIRLIASCIEILNRTAIIPIITTDLTLTFM